MFEVHLTSIVCNLHRIHTQYHSAALQKIDRLSYRGRSQDNQGSKPLSQHSPRSRINTSKSPRLSLHPFYAINEDGEPVYDSDSLHHLISDNSLLPRHMGRSTEFTSRSRCLYFHFISGTTEENSTTARLKYAIGSGRGEQFQERRTSRVQRSGRSGRYDRC